MYCDLKRKRKRDGQQATSWCSVTNKNINQAEHNSNKNMEEKIILFFFCLYNSRWNWGHDSNQYIIYAHICVFSLYIIQPLLLEVRHHDLEWNFDLFLFGWLLLLLGRPYCKYTFHSTEEFSSRRRRSETHFCFGRCWTHEKKTKKTRRSRSRVSLFCAESGSI